VQRAAGRRCSRSATCWLIMTARGRPGRRGGGTTLTRSIETPSPPAGLASGSGRERRAPGPGRDICRTAAEAKTTPAGGGPRRGSSAEPGQRRQHGQLRGRGWPAGSGGKAVSVRRAPAAPVSAMPPITPEQHGQREPRRHWWRSRPAGAARPIHGRHSPFRPPGGQDGGIPAHGGAARRGAGAARPHASPGGPAKLAPGLRSLASGGPAPSPVPAAASRSRAAARPSLGHAPCGGTPKDASHHPGG